jgi:hypothetical protein
MFGVSHPLPLHREARAGDRALRGFPFVPNLSPDLTVGARLFRAFGALGGWG